MTTLYFQESKLSLYQKYNLNVRSEPVSFFPTLGLIRWIVPTSLIVKIWKAKPNSIPNDWYCFRWSCFDIVVIGIPNFFAIMFLKPKPNNCAISWIPWPSWTRGLFPGVQQSLLFAFHSFHFAPPAIDAFERGADFETVAGFGHSKAHHTTRQQATQSKF